jgi:hypothetical protein
MKFWKKFNLGLIACLVMLPGVAKAEEILLLELQYKSDAETVGEVQFYGNEINPNSVSIDDRFSIQINGNLVEFPEAVYQRLNLLRRSFSYDSLSGGIQQPEEIGIMCLLGGQAEGVVLEARYLTFEETTFRITDHEMRPVFGMAQNCLFTDLYRPKNPDAQEDARAVVEILNILRLID